MTEENVFVDLLPQSLYGSLIEMKLRIHSPNKKGKYQLRLAEKYKIVSIDSEDRIEMKKESNGTKIMFFYEEYRTNARLEIGKFDKEQSGGRACDDSGWDFYPLMSNEIEFEFQLAPYSRLLARILFPKNCHGYVDEKFTYIKISDSSLEKKYHFPEEETEDDPHRLKMTLDGYPDTNILYYCIDQNRNDGVDIKVKAYFREAFIFYIISIFSPLLYGIPIIMLWAYQDETFGVLKKIPIMIAVIPFYVGLWYKSNIMKSAPTVFNFLSSMYIFLYILLIVFAFLLTIRPGTIWIVSSVYFSLMLFIFVIIGKFTTTPLQESRFLRLMQKLLRFFIRPFQKTFRYS